jgi:hypothetical protein
LQAPANILKCSALRNSCREHHKLFFQAIRAVIPDR